MFVDDVSTSSRHRLNQILHTLKHVHDFDLKLDESSVDEITTIQNISEVLKTNIVQEGAFNNWHSNPDYAKHLLIVEATRLYLKEIAPRRRPRKLHEGHDASGYSEAANVGYWLMNYAETASTDDETLLKILNSFSRVGNELTRVGEEGSHQTLTDLIDHYETRANDSMNDDTDRRHAKEDIHALRVGFKLYKKHHADDESNIAASEEMAETNDGIMDNDVDVDPDFAQRFPELVALAKKYGIGSSDDDKVIADEGNEFSGALAAARSAHKDKFTVGNKQYTVKENESSNTLVQPTFMDPGDLAAFEKARADWLKSGQLPDYIEQLNDVISWGNNANMTPAEVKQIMPRLLNFAKLIQWHVQPKIEMSNPSWMSPTVLPVFTKLKAEWLATNPSSKDIEGLNQYINDFKKMAGNTTPAARSQAAGGVFQYMKDHPGKGGKINESASRLTHKDKIKVRSKQYTINESASKGRAAGKRIAESHMQNHDYQASMARSELYRNAKYAMDMLKMVRPDEDIEPWIAAALTTDAMYLDKIYHYLDYYTKFEPDQLPGRIEQPDFSELSEDDAEIEEATGSIARANLVEIFEYSVKLFHMIQPGDKLEGWVAMKLTTASEGISSAKHYLDYKNFERHAAEHFDLAESRRYGLREAVARKDFKLVADLIKRHSDAGARHHMAKHHADVFAKMDPKFNRGMFFTAANAREQHKDADSHPFGGKQKKKTVHEAFDNAEQDLQQAETLIAAKSISDDLQTMAEKVARMGVDELMPLVDTMKTQFGPEMADAYNNVMKAQLDALLTATQAAKDQSDDAVIALQNGGMPGSGGTDIENLPAGDESDIAALDDEESDGLGTTPSAAGGGEPLGRAKKIAPPAPGGAPAELAETRRRRLGEKWDTEMKTAEKDKGKWDGWTLAKLKARHKTLMDKATRTAAEQTEVKQINFAIRAKQKDKFGKINEGALGTIAKLLGALGVAGAAYMGLTSARDTPLGEALAAAAAKGDQYAAQELSRLDGYADVGNFQQLQNLRDTYLAGAGATTQPVNERATATRDNRAERAGRKVAKDIEYDERKKDGIHGAKRGAEDGKAERAGRRVAKDIEHDEKVNEAKKAKPDFRDFDKDGNKEESMKKAIADKAKAPVKKYGVSAGHKMDEANKWLKAGAVAALAGAGMGSAARAQDTTSTNVAMQSQAQLVDPHFISKEAEPEFLKLQTAWLKTGAWESREYNKKVEEGNKFLLNANNLGGVEYVEQVLTKDLTDWLKKTLPAAEKRNLQQPNARGRDLLSQLLDPTFIDPNAQVLVINRDKWLATNPQPGQIEDYNEVIDFYNRAVPTMGLEGRKKAIVGILQWLASTRNAGRGFNEAKKAKPDFLDMDKDGDKNEPMKKAIADKAKAPVKKVAEAKAKPDFLDMDKDGDKKEPMKKAIADRAKAKPAAKTPTATKRAALKNKLAEAMSPSGHAHIGEVILKLYDEIYQYDMANEYLDNYAPTYFKLDRQYDDLGELVKHEPSDVLVKIRMEFKGILDDLKDFEEQDREDRGRYFYPDAEMDETALDMSMMEAKKAKSPYAIGMWQAKKEAGMNPNKPAKDLPKKVVTRGHKIARGIDKTDESVARLGSLLETACKSKLQLESLLARHRAEFAGMVNEGRIKDVMMQGQGLEGDVLQNKINETTHMITKLEDQIHAYNADSRRQMKEAIAQERKAYRFAQVKAASPWGVMVESVSGRDYKFFKDQQARDYWVQLNSNVKAKLIGPAHFDKAASN